MDLGSTPKAINYPPKGIEIRLLKCFSGIRYSLSVTFCSNATKGPAIEVHLWLCEDSHIPKNTSCRINVKNIEELYAEYKRVDIIHPNSKLELKPWGLKEFVVLDLNGNAIHFAEPVD